MTVYLRPSNSSEKTPNMISVKGTLVCKGVRLSIGTQMEEVPFAIRGESIRGTIGPHAVTITFNEPYGKLYRPLKATTERAAQIALMQFLSDTHPTNAREERIVRVAAAALIVPKAGEIVELPNRVVICRWEGPFATIVSIFSLTLGPIQKGTFRQASPMTEEVLRATPRSLEFGRVNCVLIESLNPKFPFSGIGDVQVLEHIAKKNGGKLPEGFQSFPKVVLENAQIMKRYGLGNMAKAADQLTLSGKLSALRGPIAALKGLENFGVCHRDIKPSNWLVGLEKNVPFGVLSDFEGVMIFPKFDWNTATPAERKEMALTIIQFARIPAGHDECRPNIPSNPHTTLYAENMKWEELFKQIWDDVCRLADRQSLGERLRVFVEIYAIFTDLFLKIQIFQTGIGVMQILFSHYNLPLFELNKIIVSAVAENDTANFEILSGNLHALFDSKLAEAFLNFFKGTLNVSAKDRFDAAQAIAAYDTILKVEGALAPPYLTWY